MSAKPAVFPITCVCVCVSLQRGAALRILLGGASISLDWAYVLLEDFTAPPLRIFALLLLLLHASTYVPFVLRNYAGSDLIWRRNTSSKCVRVLSLLLVTPLVHLVGMLLYLSRALLLPDIRARWASATLGLTEPGAAGREVCWELCMSRCFD